MHTNHQLRPCKTTVTVSDYDFLIEALYLRFGARLILPRTNASLIIGRLLSVSVPAESQKVVGPFLFTSCFEAPMNALGKIAGSTYQKDILAD